MMKRQTPYQKAKNQARELANNAHAVVFVEKRWKEGAIFRNEYVCRVRTNDELFVRGRRRVADGYVYELRDYIYPTTIHR